MMEHRQMSAVLATMAIFALAGCGEGSQSNAPEDTDAGTDADTGADAATCDVRPDLAAHRYQRIGIAPDLLPRTLLPGGDFLSFSEHQLTRLDANLQQIWSVETEDADWIDRVVATDVGEIVVVGTAPEGGPNTLWLARYDEHGSLAHEQIIDDGRTAGSTPLVAGTTTGGVRVVRYGNEGEAPVIAAYDEQFEEQWRHEVDLFGPPDSIAIDTDGHTYLVVASPADSGALLDWDVRLLALDVDGEELWSSETRVSGLQLAFQNDFSVGDQIYLRADRFDMIAGAVLAFRRDDGSMAWEQRLEGDSELAHYAMAASPCGGIYLGGRSAEGRAMLWLLDEEGREESVADFSEVVLPEDYHYSGIDHVEVSPRGELVVWGNVGHLGTPDVAEWLRAY